MINRQGLQGRDDLDERTILHNCGDWKCRSVEKLFGKHLGKVILMMPNDRALDIMHSIVRERNSWQFAST